MNAVSIISLCFSGVMMLIGVITFIFTIKSRGKNEGETLTRMSVTLENLAKVIDEIKDAVSGISVSLTDMDKRVSALEIKFTQLENQVEYLKSLVND